MHKNFRINFLIFLFIFLESAISGATTRHLNTNLVGQSIPEITKLATVIIDHHAMRVDLKIVHMRRSPIGPTDRTDAIRVARNSKVLPIRRNSASQRRLDLIKKDIGRRKSLKDKWKFCSVVTTQIGVVGPTGNVIEDVDVNGGIFGNTL